MSPEHTAIERSLIQCRTIAVVGLSPKPHRDSYRVSQYMQTQGYRIIPVNPLAKEVLGERAYASLSEAAQRAHIDMVNCFRNAQDIPPIAKALWLQIGITHAEAAAQAMQAGLWVVQDRCLMVEHARWVRQHR
jgi:predicted CoA-binding protein